MFIYLILAYMSSFRDVHGAVTDAQLSDFMSSIWHSDVNAVRSVRVDVQGHTATSSSVDMASNPLFSNVDDNYFLSRPTYAAFLALLDNYNHLVGGAEQTTTQEINEVASFLHEISKTAVMQKTLEFLHQNGYVSATWSSLETFLQQIWFANYARHGQAVDSSGFEHVFVGETDSKEIVGFHNWIQFHLQEKTGDLNYLGYIFQKHPNRLGIHFTWHLRTKPLGTIIYGTSPEFDIAMFTVCYMTRRNQHCSFAIDNNNVQVQTYDITHGGGHHLGTAYVN